MTTKHIEAPDNAIDAALTLRKQLAQADAEITRLRAERNAAIGALRKQLTGADIGDLIAELEKRGYTVYDREIYW